MKPLESSLSVSVTIMGRGKEAKRQRRRDLSVEQGGTWACDMKNFTHRKGRLPSSAQLINRFVQLLKDTCDIQELPRVVSFPTNPGSMMSVKFLIALRWKHYLLFRSPPKAASQQNFPSNFKWQKLALSAPLKPRKVAMHPRFTTPERLTPSYAPVGGRGGEKILRY